MLVPALLAAAAIAVAAYKLTTGPNLPRIALGLRLPLSTVQSAAKWARHRHLPLEWVLATILVESNGDPNIAGDSGGRSVGLMQVNSVAHAAELAAAGVSRAALFDPDTNIEWGTKYLAAFRSLVTHALDGKPPPAPLDEIVRLSYKGPQTVVNALQHGTNPLDISWAPSAIAAWRKAMARVSSLTHGSLTRGRPTA